jgi:hypothetical protein
MASALRAYQVRDRFQAFAFKRVNYVEVQSASGRKGCGSSGAKRDDLAKPNRLYKLTKVGGSGASWRAHLPPGSHSSRNAVGDCLNLNLIIDA